MQAITINLTNLSQINIETDESDNVAITTNKRKSKNDLIEGKVGSNTGELQESSGDAEYFYDLMEYESGIDK